ncbi:MAG: hypothetical protein IPM25_19295 [Chloracidobacterium sp.]|nr:hypothetical protein [Chloracidobacterium sp.]
MELPFEVEVSDDLLHIKHPPGHVITPESAVKNWELIAMLCRKHRCRKVLIEAHQPARKLDTIHAFESGRTLAEGLKGLTIAMCFVGYQFDDLSDFFKTVAQNRGATVEFFTELEEAEKWLGVMTGEAAAKPQR